VRSAHRYGPPPAHGPRGSGSVAPGPAAQAAAPGGRPAALRCAGIGRAPRAGARSAPAVIGSAARDFMGAGVRITGPLCALALGPHALGLRPLHNRGLCKPGPRATATDPRARAGRPAAPVGLPGAPARVAGVRRRRTAVPRPSTCPGERRRDGCAPQRRLSRGAGERAAHCGPLHRHARTLNPRARRRPRVRAAEPPSFERTHAREAAQRRTRVAAQKRASGILYRNYDVTRDDCAAKKRTSSDLAIRGRRNASKGVSAPRLTPLGSRAG